MFLCLILADREFIDRQMPDPEGFAFLSNARLCRQVYMSNALGLPWGRDGRAWN